MGRLIEKSINELAEITYERYQEIIDKLDEYETRVKNTSDMILRDHKPRISALEDAFF